MINATLQALVKDMRDNIHRGNGYTFKPLIQKGMHTFTRANEPFIEVSAAGINLEITHGPGASGELTVVINAYSIARQQDNNDEGHMDLIEDILQYLYNDCVYKDNIEIIPEIPIEYGSLEGSTPVLASTFTIKIDLEYTFTEINN